MQPRQERGEGAARALTPRQHAVLEGLLRLVRAAAADRKGAPLSEGDDDAPLVGTQAAGDSLA